MSRITTATKHMRILMSANNSGFKKCLRISNSMVANTQNSFVNNSFGGCSSHRNCEDQKISEFASGVNNIARQSLRLLSS